MKKRILLSVFTALIFGFSFSFHYEIAMGGGNPDGSLNLNWQQLGPDNIAGRTRAILFDNRDSQALTVYAAGVNGGIWKSTDLGLTWSQINLGSGRSLNVTCFAQTSNGVIYAGTGEAFCSEQVTGLQDWNYTSGLIGHGMYKSEDGENFTLIAATNPALNDPNAEWAYINEITIDPSTGRIYAATNTGLKYSDNGENWSFASAGARLLKGKSKDIKIGSDGTLVASVNDSCFISSNGQPNGFVNHSLGTETTLPTEGVSDITFAIAPQNAQIIYASVVKSDGNLKNLYRSDDKGETWYVIFPGNSTFLPLSGRGCYNNTITVSPTNADVVYLGGADMWQGHKVQENAYFAWEQISFGNINPISPLYVTNSHHRYVFRPGYPDNCLIAHDGGVSLANFSGNAMPFQTLIKNYKVSQFYSVDPGIRQNYVLGGTHGNGVIYIDGTGNTSGYGWTIHPNNGGYSEVSAINPNIFIYSFNPNETASGSTVYLYRSDNKGATNSLTFINGIVNDNVFVRPFLFKESFNFEDNSTLAKYKATTKDIAQGEMISLVSESGQFPFSIPSPVAVQQGDSIYVQDPIASRFYVAGNWAPSGGGGIGIFMTKDILNFYKSPTWYLVSKISDVITSYAGSDDFNYVWAGCKNGKLFRISNLALAQDSTTADVHSNYCIVATEMVKNFGKSITSIAVNPENSNQVLVTIGNYGNTDYVFLSNNALDSIPTFVSVQSDLPKMPVYSSLFEINNPSVVILGTENGVYTTSDINTPAPSWTADNAGLGEGTPVFMMKQQTLYHPYSSAVTPQGSFYYPGITNFGDLYIASYGKGLFVDTTYHTITGIDPVYTGSKDSKLLVYPNPAYENITISTSLENTSTVNVSILDFSGRVVKLLDFKQVQPGSFKKTINIKGLNQGTYFITLKHSQGVLNNRFVVIQ